MSRVVVSTRLNGEIVQHPADDWHVDADSGLLTVLANGKPVANYAKDAWGSVRLEDHGGTE